MRPYELCCGRLHLGIAVAETPLQLMRSRYSAYARSNINYIVKTQAQQAAAKFDANAALLWAQQSSWQGLEIIAFDQLLPLQNSGSVTFKAYYILQGQSHIIYEKSKFLFVEGSWFYVSGRHLFADR